MFRSLALSAVLHLGCAAVLVGVYSILPKKPVVFYVEPVWEGSGFGSGQETAVKSAVEKGPLVAGAERLAPKSAASAVSGRRAVRVEEFLVGKGNRAPEYPEEALTRGWEGEVEIGIHFVGGKPDVTVVRSSGYGVLDAEAVRTAQSWHLPAGLSKEQEEYFSVPIEFTLKAPSEADGE
ncbi:MAG: energy transducer TonB [Bdellovibrionaceae bacterium]|nr:energy transducer TonB [Bdellovibrionales bacterium]MCB9254792.1 energy transducer TonB [Pseudobdellovibrionaceae bacterium]